MSAVPHKTGPSTEEGGRQRAWPYPDSVDVLDDPLLDCLLTVSRIHGLNVGRDALCAGLPLEQYRLTPALFPRAARRAGLSARLVKRPLRRISSLVLPAILLLEAECACVLAAVEGGRARVVWAESDLGESWLDVDELARRYTGYAFFLRRQFHPDDRVVTDAERPSQHWFWGTLLQGWRIYRDAAVASLLVNVFGLAGVFFILNVYDRVVPNRALETLWVLTSGMLLVYVFETVLLGLRSYFIDLAARQSDLALSAAISEKVLGLRMEARPSSVGSFANQVQQFERLRDFITSATLTTIIDLPFMLLFLWVLHWLAGPIVWIPLIGIGCVLIYTLLIQRTLRRSTERIFQASAQRHAALVESMLGLETIKAFGSEGSQQRKLEQLGDEVATRGIRARLVSHSATLLASFLRHMVWLSVAVAGVYQVIGGHLSQGGLIAALVLSSRIMTPMSQLVTLALRYNQARTALGNLNHLMELPTDRVVDRRYTKLDEVRGRIDFEAVTFAYPGQAVPAVDEVTFQIGVGEKVGIVGRSGSGKTTLLKLMLGLYSPDQGSVRLDGIDIRQIDPTQLRRHMGYTAQDVMLFYGSLGENIALGAPFVEADRIRRAAFLAGVTEFADRHPQGLDMPVGERGEKLSGGQRQAVTLARALLLEPQILLLDEPTSSMDNASESRLKSRLTEHFRDQTLIIVTHRTSLLDLVDRLLVIDRGRLVADGPREEVLDALRKGRLIPTPEA